MSSQTKKQSIDESQERETVKFLETHSDFFERHPDLLGSLHLSHASGQAISLIEKQVSVLRKQNDSLKNQLEQLISNATINEKLSQHINALILSLLDTDSLEAIIDIVENHLSSDFNADAVVIRLFNTGHPGMADHPDIFNWDEPALGAFEKIIAGRKPICGSLKPGQLDSLFDDASGNIGSAALIPLLESDHSTTCYGMLGIGSHDPRRFRSDMGTMFLKHLGDVLARVLRRHLGIKK